MKSTSFIFLCFLLLCSASISAQISFLNKKIGIKKISSYTTDLKETITAQTPISTVEHYDKNGQLTQFNTTRRTTTYTYSGKGISIHTTYNNDDEFVESGKYSIDRTANHILLKTLEYKVTSMVDMGGLYGGKDYKSQFSTIPESEQCKDCTHKSETRYTLDEKGRFLTQVKYRLNRYGSLRRKDITTYEWVSDSLCIIRRFKPNTHNKLLLAALTVKDIHDASLFFHMRYEKSMDHLDTEALKEYKTPVYKYNDQGDWIERIEPSGKKKTVRQIIYY